jgi:AbrB family looped-hinge helix DNA binding protein
MAIAQSKLTAQGQISVPAEVRKRLSVGPGAILEWDEQGGAIVVRRAAKFKMTDVHAALFPEGPPKRKSADELKRGIADYMRTRHARD